MEGSREAGNRRGRPEGETPKTSGSAEHAGARWRSAPGGARASSDAVEPHGSCGSPEDPLVPGLAKHPVMPARRVMVRPDAEGSSMGGDELGRKPWRQSGNVVLRRGLGGLGTTAVEPGRQGTSANEAAELSISYSSEFEIAGHRGRRGARGAATRLRPDRPKRSFEREPHERQRT